MGGRRCWNDIHAMARDPCRLVLAQLAQAPASAASCTREDFALAVDRAGAALRKLNADNQPRLRAKMRELKVARGWPDAGFEEKAYEALQDERMAALDAQANDLLAKLDALGTVDPSGEPDCAKLQELTASQPRAAGDRQGQGCLHAGQARPDAGGIPRLAPAEPKAKAAERPRPKSAEAPKAQPPPAPAEGAARPPQDPGWETRTKGEPSREVAIAPPPPPARRAAASPPAVAAARGGGLHHRRDHGGERRLLRQGVGQPRRRHRVPVQEQRPSHRLHPGHRRRRRVPGRRALRQRHPLHARRRHADADDLLARALDRHRRRRRRLEDAVPDLPAEGRRTRSTRASPASTGRPISSAASAPRSSPTAA